MADLPKITVSILKFLIENEVGKQIPMKEEQIKPFICIIDGILNRDIKKIMENIRKIKDELGLGENKYIDLIESLAFLTNKLPVYDSDERSALITRSVSVITDWLSSLMIFKDAEKKDKYMKMINSLMTLILGAINMDFTVIRQGATQFIPMVGKLSKLWEYLKEVKAALFTANVPLKHLAPSSIAHMIQSFVVLIEMVMHVSNMLTSLETTIKTKESDLRTMNLPVLFLHTHKLIIFEFILIIFVYMWV